MGDLQGISKARKELEELYSGIPDESVNLTFQDFAEVRLQNNVAAEKKHNTPKKEEAVSVSPLTKLPSLDFNRALNKPSSTSTHHDDHYQNHQQNVLPHRLNHHPHHPLHAYNHVKMDHHHHGGGRLMDGSSPGGYDDVSGISMASNMSGFSEINGMRRRRPGIPHSNICTVCSNYIYIFRHRCLVFSNYSSLNFFTIIYQKSSFLLGQKLEVILKYIYICMYRFAEECIADNV